VIKHLGDRLTVSASSKNIWGGRERERRKEGNVKGSGLSLFFFLPCVLLCCVALCYVALPCLVLRCVV
jgi:hypothetical protein